MPSAVWGRDDLSCPLSISRVKRLIEHAYVHPWRGDTPLSCPEHIVDTTAITERGRPTRVILSLDTGYHASGWFPNSQMDRCLHLSLSHPRRDRLSMRNGQMVMGSETPTDAEASAWGRVFFTKHAQLSLFEPAATPFDIHGRLPNIVHLRLWLDQKLQPIKPEGEAYTLLPYPDGSSPAKIVEGRFGADTR